MSFGRPGALREGRASSALLLATLGLAICDAAVATTYRCENEGRVLYSDQPCLAGRQSGVVAAVDGPNAGDRSDAATRSNGERAALAEFGRRHERELSEDRRAAALAAKRDTALSRQAHACEKLALRVKRAHDDYDAGGPGDPIRRRQRMQRAEDDHAALCRSR